MPLEGHEKYKHTCCALPKGNEIVVQEEILKQANIQKTRYAYILMSVRLWNFKDGGS